ncbi:MAG: hypothetical protein CK604_07155 [Curvibacter sp. PD_MW3]|nr:MAG: hypothetical protein CK604_07155 [Curvibacter sp. PD_MW3]
MSSLHDNLLDFLDPCPQESFTTPAQADASPNAAEIVAAMAVAQAAQAQESEETTDVLVPMYDSEGRKLGPRGVLVVTRAKLLAAHKSRNPDGSQIQILQRMLVIAEKSWQAWCVKTGNSPEKVDFGGSELSRYERARGE